MKVIAARPFISPVFGQVTVGQELEVGDALAANWIAAGLCTDPAPAGGSYDTKVVAETPSVGGEGKPASSSPPGRRSRKKKQPPSGDAPAS